MGARNNYSLKLFKQFRKSGFFTSGGVFLNGLAFDRFVERALDFAHHGLGLFFLTGDDEFLKSFDDPRNLILTTQIKLPSALRASMCFFSPSGNCHKSILADFAL